MQHDAAPNKGTTIWYWFRSPKTLLNPLVNGKIQGLFKAFEWFSSTFQGRFIFQGLFKNSLLIQVLFKPVPTLCTLQTYFPCIIMLYFIHFCMFKWASARPNYHKQGTKLAQNFREKWLLPAGKLGRSDSQIGRSHSAKLRPFMSIKKQISLYTYYCHLMEGETQCSGSRLSDNVTTARICVVTEWKWVSLKKKKVFFFFLGRLPLLPRSHLGRNFGP